MQVTTLRNEENNYYQNPLPSKLFVLSFTQVYFYQVFNAMQQHCTLYSEEKAESKLTIIIINRENLRTLKGTYMNLKTKWLQYTLNALRTITVGKNGSNRFTKRNVNMNGITD